MEEFKIIPKIRQLVFSKLAQFCTDTKGSDLYHLDQALEILRSAVGDEPLKEHYKDKYDLLRRTLFNINIRLNKLKLYYDSISSFDDRLKEQKLKEIFNKDFSRIPLVNSTMFNSLKVMLESTDLKFMSIPNEYFKRMEKEHKVIEPMSQEQD